jgi:ERCC4-related helicase
MARLGQLRGRRHPKVSKLIEVVAKHFQDALDKGELDSRVMIFSSSRETVRKLSLSLCDRGQRGRMLS